jgi:hypothetical protein
VGSGIDRVPSSITSFSAVEIPGYLGSTSFSEVFKRSQHQSDDIWLEPLAKIKKSLRSPATYTLSTEKIASGATILDIFTDFPFIKRTIEDFYSVSQIAIAPLVTLKNSLDSIQQTLNEHSTKPQRLLLAEQIFGRTYTPLVVNENITADNFHLSFTGVELRWEIIGVLFTMLALGSLLNSNGPQPNSVRLRRQQYTRELTAASGLCVSFCERSESLNDLLIWLLHSNSILLTFQYGDTSM